MFNKCISKWSVTLIEYSNVCEIAHELFYTRAIRARGYNHFLFVQCTVADRQTGEHCPAMKTVIMVVTQ